MAKLRVQNATAIISIQFKGAGSMLSRLKFTTIIIIFTSFVFALLIALFLISVYYQKQMANSAQDLLDHPYQVTNNTKDIRINCGNIWAITERAIFRGAEISNAINTIEAIEQDINKEFEIVQKEYLGPKIDVAELHKHYTTLLTTSKNALIILQTNNKSAAIIYLEQNSWDATYIDLSNVVDKILKFADAKANFFNQSIHKFFDNSLIVYTILMVCALFILLYSLRMLILYLNKEFQELDIRLVAIGNDSFEPLEIDTKSCIEFNNIKHSINTMWQTLLTTKTQLLQASEKQARLNDILHEQSDELEALNQELSASLIASTEVNSELMEKHREVEEANAEVEASRDNLRAILDEQESLYSIKTAGFAHAKDRKFIWTNETFEQMLGYNRGELQNTPTRIIYIDDDEYESYGMMGYQEVLATGTFTKSISAVKKDGTPIILLTSMNALPSSNMDVMVVFIDITEQKRLENHLQELVLLETQKRLEKERLLIGQSKLATIGEMISNIAHQWRQPLNTLAIKVQDIVYAYEFGELDKEYIEKLSKDSMNLIQYMSQTIDDFRNFFKPEKEKTIFDVKEYVTKACVLAKDSLNASYIELGTKFLDEELKFYGYPNEFAQVILNILTNAKDALKQKDTTKDRHIDIEVFTENGSIKVTITDNAGGITKDIIGRVFEPYFTTKDKSQGTGLGLYMSKMIIEQNMGGKLSVCNKEHGACFEIEIKLIS